VLPSEVVVPAVGFVTTWIAKWIGGETVSDTYDVRASVGCTGNAVRNVITNTAPSRFCKLRLALNAANSEGA